ncbi:restriction endonuclease subunit S [Arthrobacter halodurans]|uniref:Restriction endonuclease subunit S n=1 Tax=Arthrobacter halodurans TaxID=516699 RepID=A0ABV4UPX4_9MICC
MPVGWTMKHLSDVVEIQRGFDLPHHARRPGPYPVLTSGDTGGFHDEGPIKGPGVTIGRATNLGRPKWSGGDFWPHNTTLFVKDFKGNNPRWVFHLFENTDLAGFNSGSVQPMLNRNYIAKVPIVVPPHFAQDAICEVLGSLDEKIAANTKLAEALATMAELQYKLLAEEPHATVPLSQLVQTQYGLTTSASNGPGPKFLRVTDINKKPWVQWSTAPYCSPTADEWNKYRTNSGDILVARMADPGKAAFVDVGDPAAVFASYLVRLKALDPTNALFIYHFLRSPQYEAYAEGAMQGSVQKNMNARVIVGIDMDMPARAAIERFNDVVYPIRAAMRTLLTENETLASIRNSLLPQLMSGKLRVKDAEALVRVAV